VAPEAYTLDSALLAQAGKMTKSNSICFWITPANFPRSSQVPEYVRTKQPPLLAVWGKSDPFFLPLGAEAFKRDNPERRGAFYDLATSPLKTMPKKCGRDSGFPGAVSWRDKLRRNTKTIVLFMGGATYGIPRENAADHL